MSAGLIFDIKEFAIHDGPGIRTTVFMKGCPLDCSWCHNPEGKSRVPQTMRGASGTRVAGREWSPQEVAGRLNRQADILRMNEGGVTFSGGEPMLQADFIAEVIPLLRGLHVLLDTSGYAGEADFCHLVSLCDLVYFDIKLIDPAAHRRYTGCDNRPILSNLARLSALGKPFVIRVPLIPGVTDGDENLAAIAAQVYGLPGLERVDLLPYNRAAGGKYAAAGLRFEPDYDESRPVNVNTRFFEDLGLEVRVV